MPADLTDMLREAADAPASPLDHDRLRQRARRRDLAMRTGLASAGLGGMAAVVTGVMLVQGGPPTPEISAEVPATSAAGCEVLPVEVLDSLEHLNPADPDPPLASDLYTAGRPTASGPHYSSLTPLLDGVTSSQLDERATTHNLEHGAVVIWFDPAQVDDETIARIDTFVASLNESGFADARTGVGILASPYTEPGIDSGSAIALRAWGVALDCDAWDVAVASQFVADHFGGNGIAPERSLAPDAPVDRLGSIVEP